MAMHLAARRPEILLIALASPVARRSSKMITDAFVVEKPGSPFKLQRIHVEDDPREDEIMVEMRATGLCHTDLNFSKEHSMPELFPAVLGHEGQCFPPRGLGVRDSLRPCSMAFLSL
jgi:hypothetical protein